MSDPRVYFEGDPQTDSARRHLERVLSQPQAPRRRWPWVVGVLAAAGSWSFLRGRREKSTQRVKRPTDS